VEGRYIENNNQQLKSKTEIRNWLADQVANILYIDPKTIDFRAPFNSFGLSSRDAVLLSGDLEEWLGRRLSPTIVYEYPTIDALADYLYDSSATQDNHHDNSELLDRQGQENRDPGKGASGESPTTTASLSLSQDDRQQRLDALEQLSEEEAEELLLAKLNNLNSR
jgi:acyl carrier protein